MKMPGHFHPPPVCTQFPCLAATDIRRLQDQFPPGAEDATDFPQYHSGLTDMFKNMEKAYRLYRVILKRQGLASGTTDGTRCVRGCSPAGMRVNI